MRRRTLRILHEGHEYWLVDRGRDETDGGRVLTLLERLPSENPEPQAGVLMVKTDIGPCRAVAHWRAGRVTVEKGHEDLAEMFRTAVQRWLEEFRLGRRRGAGASSFVLSGGGGLLFELSPHHPNGLAVLVYSDRERAEDAARRRRGIDAPSLRVEEVSDLADFLAARMLEGYAGALLDERTPIYFCVDEEQAPRFLLLERDEASGDIVHRLLLPDGRWNRWEGEEEILPQSDEDLADECMRARLGEIPFFGFREGGPFLHARTGGEESVTVVEIEREANEGPTRVAALFVDEAAGRDFAIEHGQPDAPLRPVEDLRRFLERAALLDATAVVDPEGHRARTATLWLHEGEVRLLSWSGLWRSTDGVRFVRD